MESLCLHKTLQDLLWSLNCKLTFCFCTFNFFLSVPDVFPQVGNLESGRFYQFRVFAANVAGVGKPSEASEAFLCEKWTMAEPGKDGAKPPQRA